MKALVTAALLAASLPSFATDVGVSVQISQPGVYGRVDIGRFPQPTVVVPQPVVMVPQPVVMVPQPVVIARPAVVQPEPIYLWVPPGHRKNWKKYCGRYGACGEPVYFVEDRWYRENVMVAHGDGPGDHDHGRGDSHGKGHHD
jgi:hypothetical protein